MECLTVYNSKYIFKWFISHSLATILIHSIVPDNVPYAKTQNQPKITANVNNLTVLLFKIDISVFETLITF